jgi:hypothetical protein
MRYGLSNDEVMTLADVSAKLGISRERVRQIEERATRAMRKKAQELGLMERREKDFTTKKLHAGMEIKGKTNILGEPMGQSPLAKLLKAHASAQKRNKNFNKTNTKVKRK